MRSRALSPQAGGRIQSPGVCSPRCYPCRSTATLMVSRPQDRRRFAGAVIPDASLGTAPLNPGCASAGLLWFPGRWVLLSREGNGIAIPHWPRRLGGDSLMRQCSTRIECNGKVVPFVVFALSCWEIKAFSSPARSVFNSLTNERSSAGGRGRSWVFFSTDPFLQRREVRCEFRLSLPGLSFAHGARRTGLGRKVAERRLVW